MLPELLTLKNFLSYRQKQILDFTKFHIALVTGENGQGKSSLLDAVTFALYSMARGVEGNKKGMADLVSNGSDTLSVSLAFIQDRTRYRVTRTYDRVKSASNVLLEAENNGGFSNISENSIRETDDLIREILKMDYDTFIISSFIMQGRSDYFTSKSPTDKIEILREMLMLDLYESAREKAKEELREIMIGSKAITDKLEDFKHKIAEKDSVVASLGKKTCEHTKTKTELELIKNKMKDLEQRISDKKALVANTSNISNNIKRFSRDLTKTNDLLKEKESKKNEMLKILEQQEEIIAGFDELLSVKNSLSELTEKQIKIETLRRQKDGLLAELKSEISLREQKIKDYEKRTEEKREENKRFKGAIILKEKDQKSIKERKAAISKEEERLNKEISDLKAKIEILTDLHDKKLNVENSINKIESIKNERMRLLNEKIIENTKQIKRTNEQMAKISIQELESVLNKKEAELLNCENVLKKKTDLAKQTFEINKNKEVLSHQLSEIGKKIDLLSDGRGHCPLCGAELTEKHRNKLFEDFNIEREKVLDAIKNLKEKLNNIDKEISLYSEITDEAVSKARKGRENANITLEKMREMLSEAKERKDTLEKDTENLKHGIEFNLISEGEKSELENLRKEYESLKDIDRDLAKAKNDSEKCEERLKQVKDNSKKFLVQLSSTIAEIENLNKNISANEDNLNILHGNLLTIKEEMSLKNFMIDLKNKISKIESAIVEINFDEKQLKELKKAKEKLSPFEEKHEKLKEARLRISEIDKAIDENKRYLINLSKEIEIAKEELEKTEKTLSDLEGIEEIYKELKKEKETSEEHLSKITEERVRIEDKITEIEKLEAENKQGESILIENENKREVLEVCVDMFGREGIPISIIRSILPQIEAFSNELLFRMTNGNMQVKFQTVKDSKQGERSTLQIDVYDNGERRRYELFSGGEQFRINLAIRIGISLFLSSEAHTPLELLVLDEGFGSQDETGKERILYEINSIKDRFKKVLIITHVGDVKENFPYEIRVIKDSHGSRLFIA